MDEIPTDSIPMEIPAPPAAPEAPAPEVPAAPAPATEAEATAAPAPQASLSAEAQAYQHERTMFMAGAQATGQALPPNFSDFGAYFDSLKEASGQYTKARQEIAALKKQAAEAAAPKAAEEAKPEAPEAPEAEAKKDDGELLIKEPKAEEPEAPEAEASDDDVEVVEVGVDQETWDSWGAELDTKGSFSEETNAAILKAFPGVTQDMVDMYVAGRKAMLRQSYTSAADVVGGQDTLGRVLDWASKNLSPAERTAMNQAFQTPARDATLLGLKARFDKASMAETKKSEPSASPNRVLNANTRQPETGFASQAELNSVMRDARYGADPAFTAEVQRRMAKTTWLYGG